MSRKRNVEISCSGKKSYLTWDHAENDRKMMSRKDYGNKSVYHCDGCGSYHVGTSIAARSAWGDSLRNKVNKPKRFIFNGVYDND